MLTIESVCEVLFMRIEIIEDDIGIARAAGSKYDDFREGGQLFNEVITIRSHSDSCLYNRKNYGNVGAALHWEIQFYCVVVR